jgi:hypothetical protein
MINLLAADRNAWDRGFALGSEGRPIPWSEIGSGAFHHGYRAGLSAYFIAERRRAYLHLRETPAPARLQ